MICTAKICLLLVAAWSLAVPGEAREPEDRHVRAYPIVAYAKDHAESLKPFADEVSEMIQTKFSLGARVENPVCCVWLELTGTPNPGVAGYVIVHQAGGTVIQASNAKQMALALKRWRSAAKNSKGIVTFPEGLMTNYKVVE